MNAFLEFERLIRTRVATRDAVQISVDRPLDPSGVWFLTLIAKDEFAIEVEWNRHRGFGLAAGWQLDFGTGVDEVYGSPRAVAERIEALLDNPQPSSDEGSVDLAGLRKLRGILQKDVADSLGITKSGLAQIEKPSALPTMQISTLQKFVAGLGGELEITARFPEGKNRKIASR